MGTGLALLLLALSWLGVDAEVITVQTSYYACVNDSNIPGLEGGYCGRTASGVQVEPGLAACTPPLALGDLVLLADGVVRLCADRMAGWVSWPHVDVWFERVSQGLAWRQTLPGRGPALRLRWR